MGYKLVWQDEFNYTGPPDPSKWNFETGGHGWGNNELQFYTDGGNAWVDGQKLTIEARKEVKGNREITSARLTTKNKGDWLYGMFEARIKLPKLKGTWPAFWMLPTDWEYGGWPRSGEIDIMEHIGSAVDKIFTTVHTEAFNHTKGTQVGKTELLAGATDDFYLYSVEWLPNEMIFRVDEKVQFVYCPAEHVKNVTSKEWPFDKRFYMVLNLAFGGNLGGSRGVDPEGLPARYEIDYVRVYQKQE